MLPSNFRTELANPVYVTLTNTEISRDSVDFGFTDKKGRSVGYKWVIFATAETVHETAPEGCFSKVEADSPRAYFSVYGTPTRNGENYGPWTGHVYAETHAEAVAMVAKRIEAARKRDAKKFTA